MKFIITGHREPEETALRGERILVSKPNFKKFSDIYDFCKFPGPLVLMIPFELNPAV